MPEKEDFYSHLNAKDITDADYAHAKKVCKDFEIKNLGEYHDLHVQSDTFLFIIVKYIIFENFKISVLKYMSLILQNFFQLLG